LLNFYKFRKIYLSKIYLKDKLTTEKLSSETGTNRILTEERLWRGVWGEPNLKHLNNARHTKAPD
jgi:hypothetical protein